MGCLGVGEIVFLAESLMRAALRPVVTNHSSWNTMTRENDFECFDDTGKGCGG